jgi:hypothetical protein
MPVAIILSFVEGLLGDKYAKFAKPLIYAVVFAMVLGLIGVAKCSYDKQVVNKYEQKAEKAAAPATAKADKERTVETQQIAQHESEVHNAVAAEKDQPIAPTSRVHACDQLRRAGSHSPACS